MAHRDLARAIFVPSMINTRLAFFKMGLFEEYTATDLAVACLRNNHTSLAYLCEKLKEMSTGKCRMYSRTELKAILCAATSKGLAHMFNEAKEEEEEQLDTGRDLWDDLNSLPPTPMMVPPTPEYIDDNDEDQDEEEEEEDEDDTTNKQSFAWIPCQLLLHHTHLPPLQGHSWFYTIFFRVNGAKAVFANINISKNKVLQRKLFRYKQAHLNAAKKMDEIYETYKDVSDACIVARLGLDPETWYQPLGESHYAADINYAQVRVENHKCKPTPLEIIQEAYPDLEWEPERIAYMIKQRQLLNLTHRLDGGEWAPLGEAVPDLDSHTLYYAVVFLLNQIHDKMEPYWKADDYGGNVFDSLWAYYASFVNLFEFCLTHQNSPRMDDVYLMAPMDTTINANKLVMVTEKLTPWEYGSAYFNTGAFHAGDLPSLYHMLVNIPLWGERQRPAFVLGKLYHKALPFACGRRHIFKLVNQCVDASPGIWQIISRISWVMLAGLYPGPLGCFSTPHLGMRHLLHVKELTDSKERLMSALSIESSSGGGPLIMSSIFGMHILYMASFEPIYIEHAQICIDWENFERETIHLVNIIRTTITHSSTDPFQVTRVDLNKTVKSPSTHVHRLRAKSLEAALMKQSNEHLEKRVLQSRQQYEIDAVALEEIVSKKEFDEKAFLKTHIGSRWHQELDKDNYNMEYAKEAYDETQRAKVYYEALFSRTYFKGPIINLVMRLTYMERMSLEAFSLLRLEEYGGIGDQTVSIMCDLVRMYYDKKCLPQHFLERFRSMLAKDFMVVCYYFNMAALAETIQFVPLSAELVKATDEAMMAKRHRLYPGEEVPSTMYDVCISLCCRKISTMMGTGKHGVKMVAMDIENDAFVCARKPQEKETIEYDSSDEEDEDDDDEEEDGEEMQDADYVTSVLEAQEDAEALNFGQFNIRQLVPNNNNNNNGEKTKRKRTVTKERAKELRSIRKAWCKIPCGQPIIRTSLRGRALIWGSSLEKRSMYLHCPKCGALHMYTILNYAGSETGEYRCNECARKEHMHIVYRQCAYCKQSSPVQVNQHTHLEVLCLTNDPTNPDFDPSKQTGEVVQDLNFCKQHYRIARRYLYGYKQVPKDELWAIIKKKVAENQLKIARGDYRRK